MSPLLQALMIETEHFHHTEEYKALAQKITAQQEQIAHALSPEFLDHYISLCGDRQTLESDAYFEHGFFTCAQLFIEMLSKYSS